MKEAFLARMRSYVGEEYEDYLKTLEEPAFRGLRVNTTKISVEDFKKLDLFDMTPSLICPESFYLPQHYRALGNHPAHLAGLFYMQEPSACSAVEVLDVQPHDWVLDLCAAPGGKSTQIAAKLAHTGFLLSNEIDHKRAFILLSNMERLGFSECMISNAHPKDVCKETKGWFDKVLVDAPCSGEGMFKKHDQAMQDWSEAHVLACAMRQKNILDSAYDALKQDGILVYSTCTYAREENEEVIRDFLLAHEDMELIDANVSFGRSGLPCDGLDVGRMRRIFPMDQGEGHFIAKLKKHGATSCERKKEITSHVDPIAQAFVQQQLRTMPSFMLQIQDKVYAKNTPFLKFKKVHILRQGMLVGEMTKQRLEPHQHFYVAGVNTQQFKQAYHMSLEECETYVRGNLLPVSGYKGYTAMFWGAYAIGFAKGDMQVLKNKYPKGLRLMGTL